MNTTIETMRSHRSVRKYKEKQIPEELLETILSSAQRAATSSYIQAYTVIKVSDRGKRAAIADICGAQPWIVESPVFLVFCADLNRLEACCRKHGKVMAKGYAEQFLVATIDTALVAQNTLLAAESLGLAGVYIGAIRNDPAKVCDLLEIPSNAYPVFGMCLGYPADDPGRKPRLPLGVILKENVYDRSGDDALLSEYDRITGDYYRSRDLNVKDETWSEQMAGFISRITRPHIKSFLVSRGFFLK
jgi:nitroreductase